MISSDIDVGSMWGQWDIPVIIHIIATFDFRSGKRGKFMHVLLWECVALTQTCAEVYPSKATGDSDFCEFAGKVLVVARQNGIFCGQPPMFPGYKTHLQIP